MGDTAAGVHRYVSFHERLQHVSIDLSRESGGTWGLASRLQVAGLDAPASVFADATSGDVATIADASGLHSTAFGSAMPQWYELNLSLPFQGFYARVMPKCESLVLLLHHRDQIAAELDAALTLDSAQNWLAWDAFLDLVPRMAFDLGPEFLPVYPRLLTAVLRVSSLMHKDLTHDDALAAKLVERAFHSAAWLFRAVSSLMIKSDEPHILLTSWGIVRDVIATDKFQGPEQDEEEASRDEHASFSEAPARQSLVARSHTRRFATEAIAHLIRKAPLPQLHALQACMITDAERSGEKMERGIAATWACSCESASHALHSRTNDMLACVMDVTSPHVDLVRRLGVWIITALVHHSHAPDLARVLDMVLAWAKASEVPSDALHTTLTWLATAAGTRKGTRVADDVRHRMMTWLTELDPRLEWTPSHTSLLQTYTLLVCTLLPRARVQDMTGPGKHLLQAFAARPTAKAFDVPWSALYGVLAVLGDPTLSWRSFRAFALPSALDATVRVFDDDVHVDAAISLLAMLDSQGHLAQILAAPPTTVVLRWTKRTRKVVQTRLERLTECVKCGKIGASVECMQAVQLAPYFPSHAKAFAPLLVECIHGMTTVDGSDVRMTQAVTGTLVAILVRVCQHGQETAIRSLFLGSPSTYTRLLQTCASSHAVLPALAELAQIAHAQRIPLPDTPTAWTSLAPAVQDADRNIVQAALRILALSVENAKVNVFAALAEAEAMGLEVHTITARNTKLRSTQREAMKEKADALQLQALVHYAIGALKINFKPVWSASRDTLVALCATVGDDVWRVSFAELQAAYGLIHAGKLTVQTQHVQKAAEVLEDTDATFASLSDTQWLKHRMWMQRHLTLEMIEPADCAREALEARCMADVRLDVPHYAAEILRLYEQHASLPEAHTDAFVPHCKAQWSMLVDADDVERIPLAIRTEQLRLYLSIFTAFKRPGKMHDADGMKQRFLDMCADPDVAVQRLALDCLLTWHDAWLVPYDERMHDLLEPSKFRDTLAHLDLSAHSDQFGPATREPAMQVFVRLLYGLMVSRRGLKTSGAGQAARRTVILGALYDCAEHDLTHLVDLMLSAFKGPLPHERKQMGFLNLLGDVLKHLGQPLAFSLPRLVETVVHIAVHASESPDPTRELRRTALRRLADFVRFTSTDWAPFRDNILTHLVHPRIATFAVDSVQSSSALLDLVCAWSSKPATLVCFLSDGDILGSVFAALSNSSIKAPVAQTILDLAERILRAGADDDDDESQQIRTQVTVPMASALLTHLVPLVQHTISSTFASPLTTQVRDDLLRKELAVMAELAPYMSSGDDAATVLSMLVPLMEHSARAIPERVKTELLRTFSLLLPRTGSKGPALENLYTLFCRLGAELRSQPARVQYTDAFTQLALMDAGLKRVTRWVAEMNAFSARTLNEPDLDTRLLAWDAILEPRTKLDEREWHSVLYQALFFVMDDELVLRTNATAVLQRFVKDALHAGAIALVKDVLLPGLYKRLHTRNETIRKELLLVLGLAVTELHTQIPSLAEMHVLRGGGDDEASVFANLYHIQTHRRVRAMHRLAEAAESGALRSKTLSELFIPLVWFFLLPNASGGIDMNMANEALACIRRLAARLQWGHYYHWLKRFMRQLNEHVKRDETSAAERLHIRGTVGVLEAWHFDCDQALEHEDVPADDDDDDADETATHDAANAIAHSLLHVQEASAPSAVSLATTVTTRILPPLYDALHVTDENRLPARLPLLVGAARLALHLPAERRRVELFKVFGELGAALRSKLQSTRDTCREMAWQMMKAVGASYFPDVVHELRRMLTRGPQLAVCAFTIHSLLVALSTGDAPMLTHLDRGVRDMTDAVMEDLFGLTSEDRSAVEYKTKVRELRHSKSLDTFEHLARLVDPGAVQELLLPVRGVLATTIEPKTLHTAQECLHRIASGISANTHIDAGAFLILCYTLIARGEKALRDAPSHAPHLAQNAHMFVELGLDLLTTALRRSRFDVHDDDTIAKLLPLVKAVGETLYAKNAPVVERGLRAVAALSRCPIPTLEESLPVMQKQMIVLLRHAGGLHSAMAQTTLRALAVVIREGRAKAPSARQLTELLNLVASDLDTPDAQGSVFALLRAIVSRAFVVPEIYDVMDRIAELLVTSYDAQVREICRSLYLAFLLDYPQGQGRLKNELEFLAKHLAYESEGGRRSVLELLSAIFAKFSADVISQYAQLFFVALVMQLANEESTPCRKHAADVLGLLLRTIHLDARETVLRMTKGWASAEDSARAQKLTAVALRVYDIAYAQGTCPSWAVVDAAQSINEVLDVSAEVQDVDVVPWTLTYQALQTMQTFVQGHPDTWTQLAHAMPHVITLLTLPHAWCRVAACRIVGAYFAAGKQLSANEYVRTAQQLVSQMYSPFLDDALTLQIVRNLVFLGKAFAHGDADEAELDHGGDETSDDESDEDDMVPSEAIPSRLAWLYTKLSHAARLDHRGTRSESAAQRVGAVLKWFAAMATQMDASVTSHFLVQILSPIQRVIDDEQAPDDLKMLASEVQDLVQSKVGAAAFTRVYAHVKQARLEKRRVRKHERMMESFVDPERAAKRRASRNTAKHESRKRKHAHFREKRHGNKRSKPVADP